MIAWARETHSSDSKKFLSIFDDEVYKTKERIIKM